MVVESTIQIGCGFCVESCGIFVRCKVLLDIHMEATPKMMGRSQLRNIHVCGFFILLDMYNIVFYIDNINIIRVVSTSGSDFKHRL